MGLSIMDSLLCKLKSLMQAKNLTIYRLTELAGLSENTIYNWYNKNAEPSIHALKAICPYLGVNFIDLFTEEGDNIFTFQENELITKFRKLSNTNKDLIIKLIDEINK